MADDLKMVYTACQGYGCHEHCIISTFVDAEGKIDHTERMVLPEEIQNDENPYSLGQRAYICSKGVISGKIPYMKERLTHPLRRVGERGEGKFEKISWDEALTEIAEKTQAIIDEYGPAAVMINDFPCGYPGMPSTMGYSLQYRFMHAYGFSSLEWEGIDMSVIRGPAIFFGDDTKSVFTDTLRVKYADHLIIWGGNPIGYTRAAKTTRAITELKEAGVKTVDIGILYDSTAAKVDEFVAVKPASDTALALAMAKYIIDSGQMDEQFVISDSVAPFLVRKDTGAFLRESDIVEGGNPNAFAFWDSASSQVLVIDRGVKDFGTAKPDLRATATANGIECTTAFNLLVESLEPYTFEYQESITGVPAETAKQVIQEYIDHEQSTIWLGAGLRYKNSTEVFRAIALLPMLAGKFTNEACGLLIEGTQDAFPVQFNDAMCWLGVLPQPCKLVYMQEVLDSFEKPDWDGQQYKALFNLYSNPVHNWPPRELWEERFFPNLDLVVVSDIRMCETVMFADYVIPDLTVFERTSIWAQGGYLIYGEPAIEPVGEARDLADVLNELGRMLGKPELFPISVDEWEAARVMPPDPMFGAQDPALATVEPPITIERLKAEKVIKINDANRMYHLYNDAPMATITGRLEFYSEPLAPVNGALAKPAEALIDDAARREKYPLHLFIGRSRFFMQGQFREIPELRKLAGDGPRIGMNRTDALARGIEEGDLVEVYNERGCVKVPVHFTNFIQPGMAHLWYAYGVEDYKLSGPATTLGAYQNVEEAIDPVASTWGPFWRSWRAGLGMPETMMMSSGEIANETIWDVLCEIRRAD